MSFLKEALSNQMREEDDGLSNPLLKKGHKSKRPDYESEPPPVTLGEDGNYYANDNRWTPGVGWSTIVMDTPVYWVPGGVERSKVDSDQWEYDEFGNVVTKDADFAANNKAINPEGQWMNEEQIRQRWDSDFGMKNFKKANPDMTVEDFLGMARETTALQAQGIDRLGEDGISPEYAEVYAKYGVKTQYEGKDGALYEFNGGGYTLTRDPVDKVSNAMTGIALGIITAGVGAALAPAIGAAFPGMSAAGTKAASSAILNMAQQAMLTGSVDLKDALISAAGSYGGAKLSDWIQESGFVDDMVGRSEKLQDIQNGLREAGWTDAEIEAEFIARGIDPSNPSNLNDALDNMLDLPVGEIMDAITGGDRSDDVEYGGADSDITGTGPDFGDDFGVDVEITPPQFPTPDDEGGGSTGGDEGDSGDGSGTPDDTPPTQGGGGGQGQYEVVEVRNDGSVVVRDNIDGDIWILEGDYQVGDIISEEEMVNATGEEGSLDSDMVDEPTDGNEEGNGIPDITIGFPDLDGTTPNPNTPTPDNTGTGGDGGGDTGGDTDSGDDTGGDDDGDGDGIGDIDFTDGDGSGGEGDGGEGDGGDGDGNGTGDGTGDGDGDGEGDGDGDFGLEQAALAGGGMFNPKWTDLTWAPMLPDYQKKGLLNPNIKI